ncbi:hypothetical protein TGRH88_033720 [Toxoplasma gondii]|uniref:Uncharacterized protein n=1 Tax=Toxoplasma gondii TaxID=5811 RepID=A0A7J6K7Z2_TOXGO|nr:hypothetical protein TGRH88_033720 [Toxoplasma gondii]
MRTKGMPEHLKESYGRAGETMGIRALLDDTLDETRACESQCSSFVTHEHALAVRNAPADLHIGRNGPCVSVGQLRLRRQGWCVDLLMVRLDAGVVDVGS